MGIETRNITCNVTGEYNYSPPVMLYNTITACYITVMLAKRHQDNAKVLYSSGGGGF